MNRKSFIQNLSILGSGFIALPNNRFVFEHTISDFKHRLKPIGRILELKGYYVWCNSPIIGPDNKLHVFFSRWEEKKKMSGWINGCEIVHAVADNPESPFEVIGTVLAPRVGYWDSTTCHNPFITTFRGKYYLYYMGNNNGKTNTKRIGLAVADSLYGSWERRDDPILHPGEEGSWDDHCTTNPSVILHQDGKFWLYYKSWNSKEYDISTGSIRGNRKYGLAFSDNPEGPFTKYEGNPIIDFSTQGNNAQLEDAFVWHEKNNYYLIARDMGYKDHQRGIVMKSKKGIQWGKPETAYYPLSHYLQQPPAPSHLKKYGRLERPQLLLIDGKPIYLFGTSQGGKYMTASPFIFKIV